MKKILIVEDELPYSKLLREQLKKNGYDVFEAANGEKGLAMAKQEHPDLILLDIRMPVMNGLTMLDELRKDEYGKSAKVILLTILEPDDEILKKVIQDQPTYYLIKSDIQLSDLINKVKELLEEKEPNKKN